MIVEAQSQQLTQKHFEHVSRRIYDLCGIKLTPGKEELVRSRLSKRLQALGLDSFDHYFQYIENDKSGAEIVQMIDVLTTNKTSFFREIQHFDFLRERVLPNLDAGSRRLRIWSAACSSGEEPYSIAITLHEELPNLQNWDAKILATDISTRILAKAKAAVYDEEILKEVPKLHRQKYFTSVIDAPGKWRVRDNVRSLIRLARLNLMNNWAMRGPFDVIFCRNVMIYFDKPTQSKLVGRFYDLLAPGGYLFVGHSESLIGGKHHFRYVQPAVYRKEGL